MYIDNFTTACDPCYVYVLPACPISTDVFSLHAGLTPLTEFHWYIEDKFGKVWHDTATTDADGDIEIPLTGFPAGYFTQYSGPFLIYIKLTEEDEEAAALTFGTGYTVAEYQCIILTFQEVETGNYIIQ